MEPTVIDPTIFSFRVSSPQTGHQASLAYDEPVHVDVGDNRILIALFRRTDAPVRRDLAELLRTQAPHAELSALLTSADVPHVVVDKHGTAERPLAYHRARMAVLPQCGHVRCVFLPVDRTLPEWFEPLVGAFHGRELRDVLEAIAVGRSMKARELEAEGAPSWLQRARATVAPMIAPALVLTNVALAAMIGIDHLLAHRSAAPSAEPPRLQGVAQTETSAAASVLVASAPSADVRRRPSTTLDHPVKFEGAPLMLTALFDHSNEDGAPYACDGAFVDYKNDGGMAACLSSNSLCTTSGSLSDFAPRARIDGHPGVDYQLRAGATVVAVADGTLREIDAIPGTESRAAAPAYSVFELQPSSDPSLRIYYRTDSTLDEARGIATCPSQKSATRQRVVSRGCAFLQARGPGVLHFEVQRRESRDPGAREPRCADDDRLVCIPIDPFGWHGSIGDVDPYETVDGGTVTLLTLPRDSLDTVQSTRRSSDPGR